MKWPGFFRSLTGVYRVTALVVISLLVVGLVVGTSLAIRGTVKANDNIHEAGHVLEVKFGTQVVTRSWDPLNRAASCPTDDAFLQPTWDVVALSDVPTWHAGYAYYLVAYPDPCEWHYDFDAHDAISQAISNGLDGSAAVGYVAADMMSESDAAVAASSGSSATWRDCWGANQCGDSHASSGTTLQSKDRTVLYAWWTGSYWEPRWGHVKDNSGKDAAIYGRDWTATATNKPVQPATAFAYEATEDGYSPDPLLGTYNPISGSQVFTMTLRFTNTGDRSWLEDKAEYCIQVAAGPITIGGRDCLPDSSSPVGRGGTLAFTAVGTIDLGTAPNGNGGTYLGNFLLMRAGYPMLLDSPEVVVVAPTSPGTPTPGPTDIPIIPSPTPISTPTAVPIQIGSPTPTSIPTSTPTAPLTDNAAFVGQSGYPTVDPGQAFSIFFTLQNTGTSTWTDADGYSLVCTSTCLGGANQSLGGASVGPGSQHTFTISMAAPNPANQTGATYRTWWILEHGSQQFGPALYIDVTVRGFHVWFSQPRPWCDSNSPWNNVGTSTLYCSSGSGLVMSQYGYTYAEIDLDSPNGNQGYGQTIFRVTAQAGLLNPSDTSVWAALFVQTPQPANQYGGYVLAVNSQGYWHLQQVISATNFAPVASGQVGINPGSFTMQILVQNGQLYGYINGQQITQTADNLNPQPGAESLMEESSHPTSSAVLWSNFTLEEWW